MNPLTLAMFASFLLISSASAFTVRIYNHDSDKKILKIECNGSTQELMIEASKTTSYTIQGSAKKCKVLGGVSFPGNVIEEQDKGYKIEKNVAKVGI